VIDASELQLLINFCRASHVSLLSKVLNTIAETVNGASMNYVSLLTGQLNRPYIISHDACLIKSMELQYKEMRHSCLFGVIGMAHNKERKKPQNRPPE